MTRMNRVTLALMILGGLGMTVVISPSHVRAAGVHTSGETGEGNAASFSDEFKKAYAAAGVDQSDPSCIAKLEAMLSQFTRDEEQAEIQLSLGVIHGQRTGLVDPAKAVLHFTEALHYELPPTVRTRVFVWRGNAQEQQEHRRAALMDYIRGLLICTQFDLSHGWPADPPRLSEDTREETAVDPSSSRGTEVRTGPASAEYLLQSRLIRIEREMLMHRFYLVEAVKRVTTKEKLSGRDLDKEIAFIVSDSRRARQISGWCASENRRPWP
jgi:hypothetical protein